MFKGEFEAWHVGSPIRCRIHHPPAGPTEAELAIPEKRVDARTLPRRYVKCDHCGVRYMRPRTHNPPKGPHLCKACRHQMELFTHDEITVRTDSVPTHEP